MLYQRHGNKDNIIPYLMMIVALQNQNLQIPISVILPEQHLVQLPENITSKLLSLVMHGVE